MCKLDEGALGLTVQVSNEEIEQHCFQNLLLGVYIDRDCLPSRQDAVHHNPLSPT